ncbi:MAG: ABC-type transport auxiliary lipoprotein family protein [Paracoccaceae bacterium]
MMKPGPALALVAVIAGCGADPSRITLPPVETAQTVRISVSSVEITQVSLPLYAESEEIAVEAESGALISDDSLLWADDPKRAVTQALVTNLTGLTSAKIAAEPWPFDQFPDARLVVRFDRFLPKANGQFEVSGQYYVARVNSDIRETAKSFKLSAPFTPGDAVSISAAQANVLKELATLVASSSL